MVIRCSAVWPILAASWLIGIYLGRRKGKDWIYAGKVDHGFDRASAKDLQARLKPLIRETQPYAKKPIYGAMCQRHLRRG